MNKQQSNQMSSLKKKLLAAIAMLLVACIMTVSSTYAWFTLSTAPEVKGISTTVGANGNLEMALASWDSTKNAWADPTSDVEDSAYATGKNWLSANKTWGNLVDLSEGYGLEDIVLYPTTLNAADGKVTTTAPLKFPKYGADGRVTELSDSTLLGAYNGSVFTTLPNATPVGVSAVGTSSAYTPRQYAVKNYKADVAKKHNAAITAATTAISEYAGVLAGLAAAEPTDGTITTEELAALQALIDMMIVANGNVSDALISAVLVEIGWMTNVPNAAWDVVVAKSKENGMTIDTFVEWVKAAGNVAEGVTVTIPDGVETVVGQYTALRARLNTAQTTLGENTDWVTVKPVISQLLDSDDLLIEGYTVDEILADYRKTDATPDTQEVITALMGKIGSGFTINFNEGTANGTDSVFVELAKMTGSYDSTLKFPEGTEVGGVPLAAVGTMSVKVTVAGNPLAAIKSVIADKEGPGADITQAQTLSDKFGYVIDLLFRTNASDSYLQLQTTATGRVYEDGTEATQGSGSNMTFTASAAVDADKIKALAKNIRVVFYDIEGNVLGIAVLDVDNATSAGLVVKMDLKLAEYDNNLKVTLDTDKKPVLKVDNPTTAQNESKALCALTANTKTGVSALVYLDGETITNADAAMDEFSGKLNLQFSSSADLKPMDNDALKNMETQEN